MGGDLRKQLWLLSYIIDLDLDLDLDLDGWNHLFEIISGWNLSGWQLSVLRTFHFCNNTVAHMRKTLTKEIIKVISCFRKPKWSVCLCV